MCRSHFRQNMHQQKYQSALIFSFKLSDFRSAFGIYYRITKRNIVVYPLVNYKLQFISSLLLLKSEKKDLTDKHIGLARTLTGLKHSQNAMSYINPC